jgi:hypothetical protein
MATDKIPLTMNKGQTPYIPTGYEGLQQGVARKRKIADALMQQGLEGPGSGARSWAQLLGSMAQAWAGKSIQKDADKAEAEVNQKIQAAMLDARQKFDAARTAGTSQEDLYGLARSSPFLSDEASMLGDVIEAKLKGGNEWEAPIKGVGPDGKPITQTFNQLGEGRTVEGFALPPEIKEINGQFVNMDLAQGGTNAPQDINQLMVRGPDGKPMLNQPYFDAKLQVSAAGAANTTNKIEIDTGKEYGKAAIGILEAKKASTEGALQTLQTVDLVRSSLKGASTGPLSTIGAWLSRISGLDAEGLAARQRVEQGLNQFTLAARGALKGQGQISDKETVLLEKANSGKIGEMTQGEISSLINTLERLARAEVRNYQNIYNKAAKMKGAENGIQLFQIDIPARYLAPIPSHTSKKKPTPTKKGQPARQTAPAKRDSQSLLNSLGI